MAGKRSKGFRGWAKQVNRMVWLKDGPFTTNDIVTLLKLNAVSFLMLAREHYDVNKPQSIPETFQAWVLKNVGSSLGLLKKSGEVVHHETHMAGLSVWERTESLALPGELPDLGKLERDFEASLPVMGRGDPVGALDMLERMTKGMPEPTVAELRKAVAETPNNHTHPTGKLYEEVGILPDGSLLLRGEQGLLFQAKLVETVGVA